MADVPSVPTSRRLAYIGKQLQAALAASLPMIACVQGDPIRPLALGIHRLMVPAAFSSRCMVRAVLANYVHRTAYWKALSEPGAMGSSPFRPSTKLLPKRPWRGEPPAVPSDKPRPKSATGSAAVADILELRTLRTDSPDPAFVFRGFRADRVDTMCLVTGSHEFEGERWQVELWATVIDQAQRKLAAMAGGRIDGQVLGKVEA